MQEPAIDFNDDTPNDGRGMPDVVGPYALLGVRAREVAQRISARVEAVLAGVEQSAFEDAHAD